MREKFLHLFRIKFVSFFKRHKKREVNGISQLFFFTKFDQIFRVGSRVGTEEKFCYKMKLDKVNIYRC